MSDGCEVEARIIEIHIHQHLLQNHLAFNSEDLSKQRIKDNENFNRSIG